MLNSFKRSETIFFLTLFIFLIIFTYVQVNSQHWSSIFYFDLTIIYNSLSVVSGYFQEYRDHPAYTQFLINGIFYKFFSIFDKNLISNLDIYLVTSNKDLAIQTLYIYSRYIHLLFYFLFAIFFFKLANYFKIKKYFIYISIVLLFLTERILYDLTVLRADVLSYLLIIASFYYLLIFFDNINVKYLLICAACITLSLLSKIQIVFYLPIIYLILVTKIYKLNEIEISKFSFPLKLKIKTYYKIFFLLAFSYILLQILLNQHIRFSDSNYLDLKLFIVLILSIIFFTNFLLKEQPNKKEVLIKIFFYLLLFVILTILILNFLSLIGIVKLSPYILLRLTNPFHYMSIVSYDDIANKYVNFEIFILMIKKFFSFDNLNFKKSLIYILNLTYIYLFFKNFKKNKNSLALYFLILLFFYFILLTFNFRYYETYILYSLSLYLFIFIFFLSKIKNNFFKSILLILMIIFNFIPAKKSLNSIFSEDQFKVNYFMRENQTHLICSNKKNRFMYWWWARKQNEVFWLDFCNQKKIDFLETNIKINNIY